MAGKKVFTVPYRRERDGKTNYRTRLTLLKSKLPRLVVRKSNKHMLVQLIEYGEDGDKIMAGAHTSELAKLGWDLSCGNIPAAYLVGLMIGAKAKGKEAILDLGLQTSMAKSKLYAVVKGASDAGLDVRFSEEVAPEEERISGKHIADYAKSLEGEKERFEKLFSGYLKNKKSPQHIGEYFSKVKQKILSE